MVLTSGFLREIRANFPQARITLVTSPLTFPIVELCPYVNEVLSFNASNLKENLVEFLERCALFCKENLWQKHFSIAFSPQWGSDNLPALLMCWLSGARERIGYGTDPYESYLGKPSADFAARDNFLLTKNIVTPQSVVADIEKHFYVLEDVGLKVNSYHAELFYGVEDFRRARIFERH